MKSKEIPLVVANEHGIRTSRIPKSKEREMWLAVYRLSYGR